MTGKTILVTGGARRIGAEICRHMHKRGHSLIIHYYSSESSATTLAKELNSNRKDSAFTLPANLIDVDASDLIRQAVEFTGRIDVLVNNASCYFPTPIDSFSEDDWHKQVSINIKAPLYLSREISPWLDKVAGNIINICDIYAEVPIKEHVIYSMTQSALSSMTRQLARELAPGIRVNAIAPGAILWPEKITVERKKEILELIPMQRIGQVSDIANCVEFLVDEASYLSGQIISIDGGRRLTL